MRWRHLSKLLQLTGWSRVALMFGCGAAAALALAPFHLWPLIFPAYGLLLHYMLHVDDAKTAFRLGWWWGFGFFLVGLYWVCISMTVDLARFGWMIPFALIGLNGALAFFPAAAMWAFARLKGRIAWINWLLFACVIFISELLRGHILTGFPWNLIGYVWGASEHSLQAASLLSIYPLSLLTLVLASSVALWRLRWPVIICASAILALLVYGELRLQKATAYQPQQSMRVVQANIAQTLKWDPAYLQRAFARHVSLSIGVTAPELVVWSESAIPFALKPGEVPPDAFNWLQVGQTLIAGAVVIDEGKPHNSIVAINHKAELVARYDKQHLVPFGEYVPLRGVLPIEKLTAGLGDFAAGQGARSFLNFHPLICYEVIFPSYAEGENTVMLNLTNDDWFGNSSGPYQHLMMARFRAVEQGKPLIRAANSGISAVIDAYGRVQASLPLHEEGVIELK